MSEQEFKFSIDKPKQEFEDHLNLPNNDRIVLSAPFGAGKTYFLKEFFEDNPSYEAIHLYPVNYSVASNTDIFELIKYDILLQLMEREIEFDKVKFKRIEFLPYFLLNNKRNALKILAPLLTAIPELGKALSVFSDRLIQLTKKFDEELEEIQIDDKQSAVDYLKAFTEEKGNPKEDDFYTQLIRQLVKQLKVEVQSETEKQSKKKEKQPGKEKEIKKTVLIIDDLDRIDPEHIFRILNVLSAQMDKNGGDNKFDFDKIILVFDQENIRNIFGNRYGVNVDYTGYIDKFYSYKVFEFFNLQGIKARLEGLLNTIRVENRYIDFSDNGDLVTGIVYVLERLIEANALTKRRLIKLFESTFNYSFQKKIIRGLGNVRIIDETKIDILFITRLLLFIYEGWEDLIRALRRIGKPNTDSGTQGALYRLIEECIVYSDMNNHKLNIDSPMSDKEYTFVIPGESEEIKYCFDWDFEMQNYRVKINQRINVEALFNQIFIHTIEQIKQDDMFDLENFI